MPREKGNGSEKAKGKVGNWKAKNRVTPFLARERKRDLRGSVATAQVSFAKVSAHRSGFHGIARGARSLHCAPPSAAVVSPTGECRMPSFVILTFACSVGIGLYAGNPRP